MTQRIAWPNPKRSLVAILRGVKPGEVEAIVGQLVEAGFELIEVPLNSPDPFVSIEKAAARFGKDVLIGAGTVLTSADCARVADAGGRLMVSPNVDADVLAMAASRSMVTMPGVFTPTEASRPRWRCCRKAWWSVRSVVSPRPIWGTMPKPASVPLGSARACIAPG